EPHAMPRAPEYTDVVKEVAAFLAERAHAAQAAGIPREAIVLDPGLGFGKTMGHNLQLLRGVPALRELGFPILVGASRKSFLGTLTARDAQVPSPQDRVEASIG